MISVIVPVYNVEKYIKKCLDSIINQTYKDLEIILINDGSTDSSGEICDEYALKDHRIKVIHKKNDGQSIARNIGIELSNGEYIGFVDSDDTIEIDMFEKLINAIEGVDIVICGHNIVYDNFINSNCTGKKQDLDIASLWNEIFEHLNNAVWNKLFKRSLLKNIRFNSELAHGEDLIFNILYLKEAQKGRLIDIPLYNYYKREGSITTGKFTRRKMLEVVSKDEALSLIEKIYPPMILTAKKYCFRARMNIIRNIYKSKLEKKYQSEINAYVLYVYENYKNVKNVLKRKEKIEFFLFKRAKLIYKLLTK